MFRSGTCYAALTAGGEMSVIGERVAIISLGMSCQTAIQIEAHIELLKELTGDNTLEVRSLPFDSTIAPVSSVSKALSADRPFPRMAELTYRVKPYWALANIYYWHHFRDGERLATSEKITKHIVAFKRRSKRLSEVLHSQRRLIFFVSNTQPDLDEKSQEAKTFTPVIRASEMLKLRRVISREVKRPFELVLVTLRDRYQQNAPERGFTVIFQPDHVLDRTQFNWQGDPAAWRNAISKGVSERWKVHAAWHLRKILSYPKRATRALRRVAS